MPLYAYACARCAARFEVLCRSSERRRRVPCEECGSKRTERQMSTFAVHGGTARQSGRSAGGGSSCASCAGKSCATCSH